MSAPVVIVNERATLPDGHALPVYGAWADDTEAKAAKRAKRAGIDPKSLRRALIEVKGVNGGRYLLRGWIAQDGYGRAQGFTLMRDGNCQMGLGGSPGGYREGVDCFLAADSPTGS